MTPAVSYEKCHAVTTPPFMCQRLSTCWSDHQAVCASRQVRPTKRNLWSERRESHKQLKRGESLFRQKGSATCVTWRDWKAVNVLAITPTSKSDQSVVQHTVKVPITSKFLFCYLIPYFMQWTSTKKFSIWIKSDFLKWFFKNLKILFPCGRPMSLIAASTWSVLWHRFRNVWLQAWRISLVLPL